MAGRTGGHNVLRFRLCSGLVMDRCACVALQTVVKAIEFFLLRK